MERPINPRPNPSHLPTIKLIIITSILNKFTTIGTKTFLSLKNNAITMITTLKVIVIIINSIIPSIFYPPICHYLASR